MDNYLITVVTVCICVGIYNVIAPNSNGLEKYSKMIGMLVVLCVIISPIKELINTFDEDNLQSIKDSLINPDNAEENEYDQIFDDYLSSFSIEEVKKEMKNILSKEFDIPDNECDIKLSTEICNDELVLSKAQILLTGKSIFKNPYSIEEYFSKLLQCSCEVLIK